MPGSKPPRPRGRPKDQSKREALLDAARDLLLSRGFDVTTDEIVARAGVARATLYANFADKEDLIEAVLRRESDRTATDAEFEQSRSMPIRDALLAFGERYVSFINERDLAGWDRLIASAASRHPDLPKRFFAAGPSRGQRILTAIIADAIARGALIVTDAAQAADDLAGLWIGFSNLEVKLGARPPLACDEVQARVAHGVDLFMRLYGAR
jgi:TetR/AcrR family transcriptional repressor of mexJK operon